MSSFREDAGFGLFVDQQLEAIEAELYRVEYQDLKARQWLPAKTDVSPGDETFSYRVLDGFGKSAWIFHASDELPNASLSVVKKTGRIYEQAAQYQYSYDDLRRAQKTGFPLDSELARLQRRAIEERFNNVVLLGNNSMGLIGFFNHPDVAVLSAGADWDAGATPGATILMDLFRMVNTVREQSKGVFSVSQIILPLSSYNVIAAKRVDTTGSVGDTILSVFQRGAGGVSVDWDISLEAAGAGSTKRAVAYFKSPSVAQYVEPLPLVIHEPMRANPLVWSVAMEEKTGGCIVRQNLAAVYMDGL